MEIKSMLSNRTLNKMLRSSVTLIIFAASPFTAETTTYSYDAKGRLIQVVKSGGPVSGTVTSYEHDKIDNRKRVQTAGAPH